MALPRALPRSMTHHDQTLYRDSFYSGIGQENDWRQLEELDPDSLAGIHLYGDTSDLQPHPHQAQQPSPAAASSPLNKYPTYEFTPAPAPRDSDWQHERHLQQLQQQAILRQLQYPDDDDDDDEAGKVQMATRHRRQHSIAQAQQLQFEQQRQQQQQQQQRQLVSPPPTLLEKEKKASRFSSRFSFLTRRRQPQQQHQRHDSMPTNTTNEPWLNDSNFGLHRLNSIGHQPRRSGAPGAAPPSSGPGATTPIDEEQQFREETMYPGGGKNKSNSRVKQMFRDVFGISKKKSNSQSPDLAFRDISLPSTHIRSSSTPAHHQAYNPYGHQQHLDQPINSQYHYSTVVAQRKGLVTPVSRPDTAQSSYQNNNNQPYNSKSRSRARESLVDPVQQLGFQKMEFDEDDDLLQTGAFSEGHAILQSSPFGGGQTSLTPPPASSVLRHSSPPHRGFFNGSQEYEQPVLITAAVVSGTSTPQGTFSQQQQQQSYAVGPLDLGIGGGAAVGGRTSRTTRPSSQMTAMPKDYVDSGCDSTGGHEHPYTTTASNATTLNPSHQHHATNTTTTTTIKGGSIYSQQQQQQQQQPYLYNSSQQLVGNGGGQGHHQHKKSLSYDYDRAMTMSSYDNGPTIVSMAQVQKVDLEGLRQGHHNHHSLHQHQLHLQQHTPPSHSHHLGMVAVESPFA
ncbi:MAG: hypothetical protein J3R72DRAFT_464319 [Linnemannia gamsii]|nr:MAG: hypothetical protein J3R72DRAFT_464319 [Linnemannia gamsii]